jgi:4-hydroxy-tetrahydrodipicolinate synthase
MSLTIGELKKKLKGVVAVQLCPFKKDGAPDLEALKENTKYILDFAKKGKDIVIMANGSTAEFYANTIDEQKKLIKTVVETVAGKVPIIVGVSQPATRRTIELAKYVEEVGGDCAMTTAPYYHHASKEGAFQYYKTVAEAVKIGIVIYNNPDVTGVLLPPDLTLRLSKIKNIVALKDNSPNVADYAFRSLIIDPKDLVLINGLGEIQYLGAAAYGLKYRGFVSFLANFAPALPYAIYESVEAGDFKKAHQALKKTFPLFNFMTKTASRRESISVFPEWLRAPTMFASIGKAALNMVGLRGGAYTSGQLPMEDLTDSEKQELKEALKEMGIL